MDEERTPVLVGVGTATARDDDPARAAEPLELMRRALRAAGDDAGAPALLGALADVAVPHGRWDYGDPGRLLAAAVGATGARTVLAEVGVLQQTLVDRACDLVAGGVPAVAVVGGEAGHRLRLAGRADVELHDAVDEGAPDLRLVPEAELRLPAETRAGLAAPLGCYAITESALWHRRGWSVDEGRDRVARLYSALADVSVTNPEAWRPERVAAAEIREAGPRNPMLAFPYTRRHVSSWSVDQAGALVLCSVATARRFGVPAARWVYPRVGVESNAMVALSARARLDDPPGLRAVADALWAHARLGPGDVDLVDLYSCFPVAVELAAEAFGLDEGRPLTVTGGMPWAGGPYNNYVLQATCRTVRRIREQQAAVGLVTAVSGPLSKFGAALWSAEPPANPYRTVDVTAAARSAATIREVLDAHEGPATIAGCTVLHGDAGPRAVAVLDLPDARRAVATSTDPTVVDSLQAHDGVGRTVQVGAGATWTVPAAGQE